MSEPTEAETTTDPGRRRRILLVDDHDSGRRSLARLLDVMGYEVLDVNDATSALDLMRSGSAFDYVLTDVRLPDLDGREVVRRARELVPLPRIALMTGWDVEPDETSRLGIDWIFLKPLDVQSILDKLRLDPPASA